MVCVVIDDRFVHLFIISHAFINFLTQAKKLMLFISVIVAKKKKNNSNEMTAI